MGLGTTEVFSKQVEVMSQVLEGVPVELFVRSHCSCVVGDEATAHYIEAEVREALGETRGCLGWPDRKRMSKVRNWLKGLHSSMEIARSKWCRVEDENEANRTKLTEDIVLRTLQTSERRAEFEARLKKDEGAQSDETR